MKDDGMNRTLLYGIVIAAGLFLAFAAPLVLKSGATPSEEGAAQRIAPVAHFELQGAATASADAPPALPAAESVETPAAAEAPAATATESTAAPAGKDGASVYASLCFTCHDVGVAGAPKKGDKAAWAARLAVGGEAALYASALNGKGTLMQPKGGNPTLSDAEVKAAVDYLLASVR
jgi:cytochrome c5